VKTVKPQHLYFDKEPVTDLSDALLCYPAKEFRSPTRSTVPLLAMLKDGREIMNSVLAETYMNADSVLHLEFTVPPQKGRGIPSHTDLMVKYKEYALAVEAKWTEPRYETVAEWRKEGTNPDNRRLVMEEWLCLLQPHAERKLELDDFNDTVYQMVHRAGSACYKVEMPRLAYLHFTPDRSGKGATSEQYQSDLKHLKAVLGNPPKFSFYLIEVEIKSNVAFERIRNLPKGLAETSRTVCDALQNGPLFEFHLQDIKRVSSV